MSLFKDHIQSPVRDGLKNTDAGIPIPLPKLSKYTNYITRGKNIVVGGRDTSGKKSFMDQMYFLNVFKWWRDLDMPIEDKPPLKFYYFNLNGRQQVVVQKWFCLMLKLEHEQIMDVPTLTSGVGRLFDLNEDHKDYIASGDDFMDELEEHLVFINKDQTPSDIYNRVKHDMDEIGSMDENGVYHLDEEHQGQLTFVYVNNTDKLTTESDGFGNMNEDALKKKFGSYMEELRDTYRTINVWVSPSRVTNSRMVKDSEPSYKELGPFRRSADLGIVLYNPFNENNNKYLGYPIEDLIIRAKNRFRTATIVINKYGLENITSGLVFLGECGYFRESPHPTDEIGWERITELLSELP